MPCKAQAVLPPVPFSLPDQAGSDKFFSEWTTRNFAAGQARKLQEYIVYFKVSLSGDAVKEPLIRRHKRF